MNRQSRPSDPAGPGHAEHSSRPGHDHGVCLVSALARAEKSFQDKNLRLTPLRRQVFEEIAGSHDAVGAYDLLDRLARKTGERLAPISVYRALDALLEAGVVHRLESRNAFFACHTDHGDSGRPMALVCDRCRVVNELESGAIRDAVNATVARAGFTPRITMIEIAGVCAACRRSAPQGTQV